MLIGCVLPWFAATGGETGLTPITTNAFSDKGIVVFICALLILALVSLPYAAGDKPVALDRAMSYGIVLAVAIGAFAWRTLEFVLIDPAGLRPDLAPGIWIVAIGLDRPGPGHLRDLGGSVLGTRPGPRASGGR